VTDVLWPIDLCPSQQTWRTIGNAATFVSPLSGATRTYGRPGVRMGCTMTWPMMKGQDRARAIAALARLKDQGNRFWVPDYSTTRRGSFPASELLTNNDFSSGTGSWSVSGAGTLSAQDRVMRVAWSENTGGEANATQTVTTTPYAPYGARAMVGARSYTSANAGVFFGGSDAASSANRLSSYAFVPIASSQAFYLNNLAGPALAGDFTEFTWSSVSRCALVDGGMNSILYSDQINNAAWTKTGATAGTNDAFAPDRTVTADSLTEDSSTGGHYITQSVARATGEADICSYGFFSRNTGTRNVRLSAGNDGTDQGWVTFSLTGNGSIADGPTNAGTATNTRAFIRSYGNGWYFCCVISRLTSAATMRMFAEMANGTSVSYAGDGTSQLAVWRVGIALASVPTRGAQTTTTGTSGTTQSGSGIYVKGLPASTSGLLEVGDFVEIGGQINRVTSRLNSDAAGLGFLQCGNPWRAATNNAPIFVNTPMCRMMLASDTIDIDTGPGQFSPFQIELVEAID